MANIQKIMELQKNTDSDKETPHANSSTNGKNTSNDDVENLIKKLKDAIVEFRKYSDCLICGKRYRSRQLRRYQCFLDIHMNQENQTEDEPKPCKPDTVQLHRNLQMRLNSHRQTLWEEQKHFAWWISIILSGLILIFLADEIDSKLRIIPIALGCIFGITISIVARRVISKEDIYFQEAKNNIERIEKRFTMLKSEDKIVNFGTSIKNLFKIVFVIAIILFSLILILFPIAACMGRI
jgi:hypothetical protein